MLQYLKGQPEITISMVCMGNICRSPMAAAILFNRRHEISSPKIVVDSSGTGAWHVGEGPNPHSKQTWEKHGLKYDHTAKKFSKNDFYSSDLILVMDSSNYANVMSLANEDVKHKVFYLRQFDPTLKDAKIEELEVPDPYSLAIGHFEAVYEMIDKAITGLLAELAR
ncbi:MAG: low molecular weight phosphotyrosine protein phosphatase [Gammaproteobacteria bacterium]|jgi:protein-tyrosine phosphatase|nr:low molecular weight phosphotyrosine protein phosphatase [Gammaproteobacteria bacterium]